jgi:hypothetical protein
MMEMIRFRKIVYWMSIEVPRQEIYHLDGPARDVVVSTFFAEE